MAYKNSGPKVKRVTTTTAGKGIQQAAGPITAAEGKARGYAMSGGDTSGGHRKAPSSPAPSGTMGVTRKGGTKPLPTTPEPGIARGHARMRAGKNRTVSGPNAMKG